MQELFNLLAALICDRDPALTRILDRVEMDKRAKAIKKITKTDSESIFGLIETASPFNDDKTEFKNSEDEEEPGEVDHEADDSELEEGSGEDADIV